MHYCYILHSAKIDRYYIGESEDPSQRIHEHNNGFYKGSFTSRASDWCLQMSFQCINRKEARKVETFIKKQKSRKFIEKLLANPGIVEDIKRK